MGEAFSITTVSWRWWWSVRLFPFPWEYASSRRGNRSRVCGGAAAELDQQFGRRFFDVVVADALYLQQGFVNAVEAARREWVITLKENRPALLAEAQRLTGGPAETPPATAPEELQLWHAPEVYSPSGAAPCGS